MHAELQARLSQLSNDVRTGQVDRAALFWLKVFADAAIADAGQVRSDRWVEAGLDAARATPGLSATALPPRQQLIARYDLFSFVRMRDAAELRGAALAGLDWQRKYHVGLVPELAGDLAALQAWADHHWATLGGVAPELVALEATLERHRPWGRAGLIEALHDTQAIFGGWLPRDAVERVAAALDLPAADVQGVIEFYEMFHDHPVGRRVVRVCQDGPCGMAGADALLDGLCRRLGVEPGQTTPDGEYTVEPVRCLGLCDRAPAALVNHQRYGWLDPAAPEALLDGTPPVETQIVGGMIRLALANVGVVDPTSVEAYRTQGGLAALHKALRMSPAQVIEEVKQSKLVGRGGAAFPAGLKWQLTADNPPGPRHVICNADESEPGAFKDRVLLEGDPFRILEGLIIACYAVGAAQGFVYIRGEYHQGYQRISGAVRQLEAAGYLGENILGSGFGCRVEVRRGAGAYICGEETALMESIEGKRGFPRLKPPFPTTAGLWGRPTAINNVETLAKVPGIILYGSRWYSSLGTGDSTGTKLFAVSGSVRRPGVYEVPFGVTLRHLIDDLAGGLRPGRAVQGILTGGAAGAFLTAEQLDTPLSFEDFKQVGGTIGAGTLMVFDDSVDLRDILARIGGFFAHESCGKCYPCQIGTQRQAEILRRIADGQARPGDADTLRELGAVMTDTSICGLGQAAALAILSAQQRWPDLLRPAAPASGNGAMPVIALQ
ncbi:MAG: NAD(P)H-dependent oxidoreductase subunit E [Kouleothrix sp.]|nr:NAD(P)H-dependent oxidoreductase subunit E [Kouleothrix sp.]